MISHQCRRCGHRSTAEDVRRDLYFMQRSIGDIEAARRGRLGRRLARRWLTRRLMRELFRN